MKFIDSETKGVGLFKSRWIFLSVSGTGKVDSAESVSKSGKLWQKLGFMTDERISEFLQSWIFQKRVPDFGSIEMEFSKIVEVVQDVGGLMPELIVWCHYN